MGRKEILIQVKGLIERPENWNKGCSARDRRRRPCDVDSVDAVQFSLLGAFDRVAQRTGDYEATEDACRVLAEIIACKLGHSIPKNDQGSQTAIDLVRVFNDITTHISLLDHVDQAIARCTDDRLYGRLG